MFDVVRVAYDLPLLYIVNISLFGNVFGQISYHFFWCVLDVGQYCYITPIEVIRNATTAANSKP